MNMATTVRYVIENDFNKPFNLIFYKGHHCNICRERDTLSPLAGQSFVTSDRPGEINKLSLSAVLTGLLSHMVSEKG